MSKPFARTYERDQDLLNRAENFLMATTVGVTIYNLEEV